MRRELARTFRVLERCWRILGPSDRRKFISLVAMRSFSGLLDLAGVIAIAFAASLVFQEERLKEFSLSLGFSLPENQLQMLAVGVTTLAVLAFALRGLFSFLLGRRSTLWFAELEASLALDIAQCAFGGNLDELKRISKGDLQWQLGSLPNLIFSGFLGSVLTVVGEFLVIVILLGSLIAVNWILALSTVGYFALVLGIFTSLNARAVRSIGERLTSQSVDFANRLSDLQNAFREIATYGMVGKYLGEFGSSRLKFARTLARESLLSSIPRVVAEFALLLAVILLALVLMSSSQSVSLETLGFFVFGSLRTLGALLPLQSALARIYVIQSQIGERVEIAIDARSGKNHSARSFKAKIQSAEHPFGIELRNVRFRFQDGEADAITGISLSIPPGSRVALIGKSGAGKSTLVDLMLGLYHPTSGDIIIDGQDVGVAAKTLVAGFAYVPQRAAIVSGSIRENVALGCPETEIDNKLVRKVLDDVGLGGWISTQKHGINSELSSGRDSLSGGQLQRLGLARALYRKPKLLFLDEATSSLDAASEHQVMTAIRRLHGICTVVIVAHRLSTVRDCDNVFLIDSGAVLDSGTLPELEQRVSQVKVWSRLLSLG